MEVFSLKKMLLWLMTLVIIVSSTAECREPVLHRVGGGKYTWAPNANFTAWAMHETFYVGDWLYFGFDKTRYNVLEVNKMNYDNCSDRNFITNITRGGRDVFNLTVARPYYFLSGHGYCFKGMKLAVYVQYAPPDPAPLSKKAGMLNKRTWNCKLSPATLATAGQEQLRQRLPHHGLKMSQMCPQTS
ncbi:unnamed protein product [Dovyalis caffra]|uniref:Phytocyanin domain-containing protein n=1 Tax=Dovyalis caffra TaxID=77055 RepID=A0AAV1RAK5_9ROSI|nr:unnamed protein product [Dovyalis caffra]